MKCQTHHKPKPLAKNVKKLQKTYHSTRLCKEILIFLSKQFLFVKRIDKYLQSRIEMLDIPAILCQRKRRPRTIRFRRPRLKRIPCWPGFVPKALLLSRPPEAGFNTNSGVLLVLHILPIHSAQEIAYFFAVTFVGGPFSRQVVHLFYTASFYKPEPGIHEVVMQIGVRSIRFQMLNVGANAQPDIDRKSVV